MPTLVQFNASTLKASYNTANEKAIISFCPSVDMVATIITPINRCGCAGGGTYDVPSPTTLNFRQYLYQVCWGYTACTYFAQNTGATSGLVYQHRVSYNGAKVCYSIQIQDVLCGGGVGLIFRAYPFVLAATANNDIVIGDCENPTGASLANCYCSSNLLIVGYGGSAKVEIA